MSEVRCDEKRVPGVSSAPKSEIVVESAEERATRLRELRATIASGAYRIPAEAVADKVMQRMQSHAASSPTQSTDRASARDSGAARAGVDEATRSDATQTGS